MKAYKLEVLIIDHSGYGSDEYKTMIENHAYLGTVMNVEEADIGEWRDDHPLNLHTEMNAEYESLFEKLQTKD